MYGLADRRGHHYRLRQMAVITQILACVVEFERQPREVAVERFRHRLEQPRVDAAGRDDLDQLAQIRARLGADRECLGGGGTYRLRQKIVQQLDDVPGTRAAHVKNVFAIGLQHRLDAREHLGRRAHHGVERAALRIRRGARQRRVHQGDAALRALRSQLLRRLGLAGGRIDHHQPGLCPCQHTRVAQHAGFHLRRTGHTQNDGVALS